MTIVTEAAVDGAVAAKMCNMGEGQHRRPFEPGSSVRRRQALGLGARRRPCGHRRVNGDPVHRYRHDPRRHSQGA